LVARALAASPPDSDDNASAAWSWINTRSGIEPEIDGTILICAGESFACNSSAGQNPEIDREDFGN
jgi:hypothetical protein